MVRDALRMRYVAHSPSAVILALMLAGCGAQATPAMWGAARTDLVRDGRSYTVFRKDNRVEVIRLGWASPGEHAAIRATMMALIPEVTGCKLAESSVQGDSGEMRGRLVACPKAG